MITNQYVLGGSQGIYPINDFTLELNYERPSSLTVKVDSNYIDALSHETYMYFYFMDNKLFEGIPTYGVKSENEIELTLFSKEASLWTVGGFALRDGTPEVSFSKMSMFQIASSILKGSQFYTTESSVPNMYVDISGSWHTKTDFLYNLAKLAMDSTGNISTVWVDNKNCVHIEALNSNRTVDLSDKIINISSQDINFIKFGGTVVKGGQAESGENILETSFKEYSYSDYNLNSKTLSNFNITYSPGSARELTRIDINEGLYAKEFKLGFSKSASAAIPYTGDPAINDVRAGKYYSAEVLLRDIGIFYQFDELDICFMMWFDSESNLAVDTLAPIVPETGYRTGMPYSYIKSISVGMMDGNGNPIVEFTLEKLANEIQGIRGIYGAVYTTISDCAVLNFILNANNRSKSIGMVGPYSIRYWNYRNMKFLVRLSLRSDGWNAKVVATNNENIGAGDIWELVDPKFRVYSVTGNGTTAYAVFNTNNSYPSTPQFHNFKVGDSIQFVNCGGYTGLYTVTAVGAYTVSFGSTGTGTTTCGITAYAKNITNTQGVIFDQTATYPDETNPNIPGTTEAKDVFGGGYPFIRAKLQTNIEYGLNNDAMWVSQIHNSANNIPMVVGMPLKTLQHKPYLFYNDGSIKFKSQAASLAGNIYNDYQKIVSADIEIDPMAFYYPLSSADKIDIGCIVNLHSPAEITGKYRIRSITATPDRVTISLKNRDLALSEIIDRIQKQMKDL